MSTLGFSKVSNPNVVLLTAEPFHLSSNSVLSELNRNLLRHNRFLGVVQYHFRSGPESATTSKGAIVIATVILPSQESEKPRRRSSEPVFGAPQTEPSGQRREGKAAEKLVSFSR